MKKFLLLSLFLVLAVSCCTIKMQDGESEMSFMIRSCVESAKKTGNYEPCNKIVEQYAKLQDDKRLYDRYEYCKNSKDESQKFSECWLSLNQR
jgi:CDP-diacylglycerol pyrophosphatase